VIDFIPHVRAHFESVYFDKKLAAVRNAEDSPPATAAETKQLEALQRQFDQVLTTIDSNYCLFDFVKFNPNPIK
jgi:hypothetical protein